MNSAVKIDDPYQVELDALDVSRARLFSKEIWRPFFRRLREEDPIHYHADSPFGPYWSITKFDDIVAVDKNHVQFSSASGITIADNDTNVQVTSFIGADDPVHGPQRNAVQPAVAPRNLANLESLIRERVIEILEGLPVGEPFNWVPAVSVNLTTQMLATLFGFPFEDRHLLKHWSDCFTTPTPRGDREAAEQRRRDIFECLQYFQALWHRRKQEDAAGFDLLSLLQRDPATQDMVDDPMDFLGNLGLLIVGGNDTTRNSISGSVLALHQNPREFEKLAADPGLIPSLVPEVIRWQTPLIHMRRTALEDVELGGKTIRRGDKVVMWYLSGNRDEEVIEQADEFIVDRPNARHHVSFGFGVHRCMGNRLAEMQLRIVWEEILQRFERIEVVGEVERIHSNFIRGYSNLPVVVHTL